MINNCPSNVKRNFRDSISPGLHLDHLVLMFQEIIRQPFRKEARASFYDYFARVTYLFVGIDKDKSLLEFIFSKDSMKLCCRSPNAFCVAAVHHIDNRLSVWVVAPPVRSDAGLASQIPDLELDILVCDRLHI